MVAKAGGVIKTQVAAGQAEVDRIQQEQMVLQYVRNHGIEMEMRARD